MPTQFSTEPLPPMQLRASSPAWWLLGVLVVAVLWDMAGLDLPFMRWLGTPKGFALRDQWLLERVLHEGLRQLAAAFYLLLWVWALWPDRWAPVRAAAIWLPRRERIVLLLLVALSLLAVNLIKKYSLTSCPWDLQAFGGHAWYVSHWALGQGDDGSGRCFPGGHASSGFSFLALCLPWLDPTGSRPTDRTLGLRVLMLALFTGLLAGAVQTLRGAHYPSHTLWTLVICGAVSLMGWRLAKPWLARHASA